MKCKVQFCGLIVSPLVDFAPIPGTFIRCHQPDEVRDAGRAVLAEAASLIATVIAITNGRHVGASTAAPIAAATAMLAVAAAVGVDAPAAAAAPASARGAAVEDQWTRRHRTLTMRQRVLQSSASSLLPSTRRPVPAQQHATARGRRSLRHSCTTYSPQIVLRTEK